MPLAESLEEPKSSTDVKDPARPVDPAAKLRKQVFLQFGALVVLGLALAGWYVGYRVHAARAAQPSAPVAIKTTPTSVIAPPAVKPVLKVLKTEPVPAPPPVEHKPDVVSAASPPVTKPVAGPEIVRAVNAPPPVRQKESAAQPFTRHDASLRPGDKYLQIAAFGPRALDGFLKTLETQGLHPLVAPGPVDNIYRILIGPFPNSAALDEARRSIQASGIEPILRTY